MYIIWYPLQLFISSFFIPIHITLQIHTTSIYLSTVSNFHLIFTYYINTLNQPNPNTIHMYCTKLLSSLLQIYIDHKYKSKMNIHFVCAFLLLLKRRDWVRGMFANRHNILNILGTTNFKYFNIIGLLATFTTFLVYKL